MLDFFLHTGLSRPAAPEDPHPGASRFLYTFGECTVTVYSRRPEKEFLYTGRGYTLLVYGYVFSRRGSEPGPVAPEAILGDWLEGENLLKLYKGNFTLIFLEQSGKSIHLINDHFGIKPVYYLRGDSYLAAGSNLLMISKITNKLNYSALLERLLFSYPIGSETYLKDVHFLNGGEEILYSNHELRSKTNFNLRDLLFQDNETKFNPEEAAGIFSKAVLQRAGNQDLQVASLTGGFDGRAVVSVLLHARKNLFTYSFGCRGGENTRIPEMIASAIPEVNYQPYFLEENFEKEYRKWGLESIRWSDGLSFFERANYNYVFTDLAKKSETMLSGLLGGELLGPVNMVADYINPFYYSTFFLDDPTDWRKELEMKPYQVHPEIIEAATTELNEKISGKLDEIRRMKQDKEGYLYYYYDLLNLGFRRFYGAEMHIERVYAENLTPFLDIDLLEYIFGTGYRKIFRNAYKNSLYARRKSKLIQSAVICNNSPVLGSIKVDRNIKPAQVLQPLSQFIIPYQVLRRKISRKKSLPEFDQKKWNELFYADAAWGNSEIFAALSNQPSRENNIAVSLHLWLKMLDES